MARVTIAYRCLRCDGVFDVAVSPVADVRNEIDDSRVCPNCGQTAGTGPVVCADCGECFDLPHPHWTLGCDVASGKCPQCGRRYASVCIC